MLSSHIRICSTDFRAKVYTERDNSPPPGLLINTHNNRPFAVYDHIAKEQTAHWDIQNNSNNSTIAKPDVLSRI